MLDNPSDLVFSAVFDTVDIGLVVLDSHEVHRRLERMDCARFASSGS